MNALAGEDDSFYDYVKRHAPTATPGSFVERRVYGDYLEALLKDAISRAPQGCELHEVIGEVVKIVPSPMQTAHCS